MKLFCKALLPALVLFISAAALNAQNSNNWGMGIKGEGPIVKKSLQLDQFTGLTLAVSGNVYLRQGSQQSVEVESHQNLIDNVVTTVENGVWKIRFEKSVRSYDKFNVYITIPTLKKAAVSGSGDIIGETPFKNLGDLSLAISGSGDIAMDVESPNVSASISGSGDIKVSGKGASISASISGSGDINAGGFSAQTASVAISGSGDCTVNAAEDLKVGISGSGDVSYSGRPRVNSKVSGSGDLIHKGM